MKILDFIFKIDFILRSILKILLLISMGGIAFLVNLGVIFRYVLASPLTWTNELSRYLLIFTVLFGACLALRLNQFVKIECIVNLFPYKIRKIVILFSELMIICFLLVCIFSPTALIQKAILTKTISPALGIPMVILYTTLRTGFIVMLFSLILKMLEQTISTEKE
ncbi:MAG: hypothetical protein DRP87_18185 [Spirochaetes bacterium]|nr:MAG: hypothetical protein DRP87_18185 [Spirochaetota bacterium]